MVDRMVVNSPGTTPGNRASLITVLLTRALAGVALGAASLAGTPALAQAPAMQSVTPYFVLVTGDKTPLRCAEADSAYAVAELTSGQVLHVDGERGSVLRVVYPPKVTAFVRAEEATIEGSTVKLSKDSRLRAANVVAGFAGSWKMLLDTPLTGGTPLKLIEPSVDKDGTLLGYRVAAPVGARAYLNSASVRRATDAEVQAYRGKFGEPSLESAAPAIPTPTVIAHTPTPSDQPNSAPVQPPADPSTTTSPTIAENTPAKPADTIAEPMKIAAAPGEGGSSPALPTPTQPEAQPNNQPATQSVASVQPTTPPITERKRATAEELEPTFKIVMAQPALTAEFDEMLAEYRRTLDSTPTDQARRRQAIESRIKALELKAEFRDKLRQAETERAQLDEGNVKLQQRFAELAQNRTYTMVGQLQGSTVYDGRRLPLMYRLQSLGGVPQTIGYIKPHHDLNFDGMLGQVVGVIGQTQFDDALKLNVINAVRVDLIDAAANPAQPREGAPPTPIPVPNITTGK